MTSPMLQRIAANKEQLFQHDEGKLKLLGVYGRLNTIVSSVIMEKLFEENFDKKKVDDLFYLTSEAQSYYATKWTVEKVGMPVKGNELKIFEETAGHSQVTGYGKHKMLKFDLKNKLIIIIAENNMFPLQYKALFGTQEECVDHYLRGLLGGIARFLFGEEVIVICEECPSMGKQSALYKIVPRKDAVKKYGRSVIKFIPDPKLKLDVLSKIDVRKLVV
ncbi:MAG: hypothetical protein GY861_12325 [bacterium]|nr:hypothetical protein [bacterium]